MRKFLLIPLVCMPSFLAGQTKSLTTARTNTLCQQTLRSTSNIIRLGGPDDASGKYSVEIPTLVYSDKTLDAYVDPLTISDAVKIQSGVVKIVSSFDGHIYFVYHDDAARGQVIADIDKHYPIAPNNTCTQLLHASRQHPIGGQTSGEYPKRGVNCADLDGSEEGHIKDLKYIMMRVGYRQEGVAGVATPNGSFIPGPLLYLEDIRFIAPRNCTKALTHDKPGQETIMALPNQVSGSDMWLSPAIIGSLPRRNVNGVTTMPNWYPIIGDLTQVEYWSGFNPTKVGPELTPLMYRVLQRVCLKIQERMPK